MTHPLDKLDRDEHPVVGPGCYDVMDEGAVAIRGMDLLRESVPELKEVYDWKLIYARGTRTNQGFRCHSCKFQKLDTKEYYSVHWHEGYTETMDRSLPATRLRSLEKATVTEYNETNGEIVSQRRESLVSEDKLYKN